MPNKLGIHIQAASAMDLMFYLLKRDNFLPAGYTVVGNLQQIYDVSQQPGPDKSKITAREYSMELRLLDNAKGRADAGETARAYIAELDFHITNKYPSLRPVWWQVFNEKMGDWEWMDRFVEACLDANDELDEPLNLVFYNYATGNPEIRDWEEMRSSLTRVCKDPHAKIGFHEYGFAGKMLGEGSLEPWRVGRIMQLRDLLIYWGLKPFLKKKARGLEGGLDDRGWLYQGVEIVAYAQGVIAAARKYYEDEPFIECYNIYDCSYIADEYSILPQYRTGTDTRFYDTLVPYMREAGQAEPEIPPDEPPEEPPKPINLLKNASFEGGYRFAEDDRLGDRKIPTGWFVGWNPEQAAPHVELDQHPPRVRDGAVALRMWADKRFNAWAGQKVQVEPGAMYRLIVQAVASREIQKPASVHVGVDLDGGEDYQAAELKHGYTSLEEWKNPTIEFKAAGQLVTVFVNARTVEDGRGDAWFDDVRLVKVAAAPPVEPPPAPAAGWYRVDTSTPTNPDSTDRLRFRAAPVNGAVIGLAAPTSEWQFESFKDGWGKLKGAELYASAQYLIKKV